VTSKRIWLAILVLGALAVYWLRRSPALAPVGAPLPEPEPFPDLFEPRESEPGLVTEVEHRHAPEAPQAGAEAAPAQEPDVLATPLGPDDETTLENTQPLGPVLFHASEPQKSRALSPSRLAAIAALATGLAVYSSFARLLPAIGSWPGVALVGLGVLPLTFALVWLALPAWRSPRLPAVILVGGGLAVLLEAFELEVTADLAKLAAVTAAGWFFLRFFEEVTWVLLVALLIVPVDIF
jgi:hypothetical protein